MQPQEEQSWQEQWWVWAIVPALVLIGLGFAVYHLSKPEAPAKPPIIDKEGLVRHDALDQYILWIKQNQPTVTYLKRTDLATGEQFEVPSVDMNNNYVGGDTTDMMSLSMAIPDEASRRPEPGAQEWQLKTIVAPKSKAAYMEIDLHNAQSGRAPQAAQNMRSWDLGKLCPALARLPVEHWTDDEKQYVHYLTVRTMGFDDTEAGFAALWAAYASNFALWHGDRRTVPAAAYYALAAAHFDRHLAGEGPPSPRAKAVTFMIDAEMHRLLGRMFVAFKCLEAAEKLRGELQEPEQKTLDDLKRYVAAGDKDLHRLEHTGIPEPPIGWYIEYLFEAVNGDLDVERDKWKDLRDVDSICREINSRIEAVHAEPIVTGTREGAADAAPAEEPSAAAPQTPPAGH